MVPILIPASKSALSLSSQANLLPAVSSLFMGLAYRAPDKSVGAGSGCQPAFRQAYLLTSVLWRIRILVFDQAVLHEFGDASAEGVIHASVAYGDCQFLPALIAVYPEGFQYRFLRILRIPVLPVGFVSVHPNHQIRMGNNIFNFLCICIC